MQNIFENPAFSMSALTAAINILPNNYDRLGAMGLFVDKPQRFRSVIVEEQNGVLTLLPTMPPGSPGTVGVRGKRKVRSFTIPHIPHDDVILPEEVQGIRAFGSETELQTVAGVMAQHLQTMRNKHAITLEHLRFGALKGQILDADGSVIYDLYNEFEITPKTFTFNITDPANGWDVKKACLDVVRYVEDNLQGERMSGLHAFVGEDFAGPTGGPAEVAGDPHHTHSMTSTPYRSRTTPGTSPTSATSSGGRRTNSRFTNGNPISIRRRHPWLVGFAPGGTTRCQSNPAP